MAVPVVFTFPVVTTNSIALTQTLASGAAVVINGTLQDRSLTSQGVFRATLPGINRRVSITSTAGSDLSTILFTIVGLDTNNAAVTATLTGPASTTTETTVQYNRVTSITANAAVASALEVGTGTVGSTNWWMTDQNVNPTNITVAVVITGGDSITIQNTLDDANVTASPTTVNHPTLASITTTLQSNYAFPPRYVRGILNSTTTTGVATITMIQASNY